MIVGTELQLAQFTDEGREIQLKASKYAILSLRELSSFVFIITKNLLKQSKSSSTLSVPSQS